MSLFALLYHALSLEGNLVRPCTQSTRKWITKKGPAKKSWIEKEASTSEKTMERRGQGRFKKKAAKNGQQWKGEYIYIYQ